MFSQDQTEALEVEEFGIHWNVKILSLIFSKLEDAKKDSFIRSNAVWEKCPAFLT